MYGAVRVGRPVVENEFFPFPVPVADPAVEIFLFPGFLDERLFLLQVRLHGKIRARKVEGVFVVCLFVHLRSEKTPARASGSGFSDVCGPASREAVQTSSKKDSSSSKSVFENSTHSSHSSMYSLDSSTFFLTIIPLL